MAEIVTFGEAMVRLSPPNYRRLEQARSLDVNVGGAELNTAVGLARLGHSSAWVSRLTANPLGRLVANHVREAGVDTQHIVWTDDDRVGVYFLEFGAAPRASSVMYDRKGSAIAAIRPGMVDWKKAFAGTKWFHVTGITPALSTTAAEATREALQAARAAGVQTSIDLNHRVKLWSQADAGRWMTDFMQYTDVLITTEEDTERVFQIKGKDFEDVAGQLARRFPLKVVAITIRENPLVWKNNWTAIAYQAGVVHRTRSWEVEIVDRLGAGDSFAAGLIHGLLEGDVQKAVDTGVAMSALKHSIPGDFAWVTREEVEATIKGGGLRIQPVTNDMSQIDYLSRAAVRELDRRAIADYGMPGVVLMENAGRGTAELLRTLGIRGRVALCCGKGNNGGDGFVIARHLDIFQVPVRILLFAQPEQLTGDAAINFQIAERSRLPIEVHAEMDVDSALLQRSLAADDWVVDALFGTGLNGPVRPPFDRIIAALNGCGARVLSVDIPSGLDCDTGQPLGPTVRALHTATFVARKIGFRAPEAANWLGQVHVVDIRAPRLLVEACCGRKM